MNYNTIFFDLGNVLIFVHFDQLIDNLHTITGIDPKKIIHALEDLELRKKIETGELLFEQLYELMQKSAPKKFSLADLEKAYSEIFTPNYALWPLVETLSSQKKELILLSNTSDRHFEYAKKNYPVLKHFDHMILSYEVGAMKPDEKIFQEALKRATSSKEECFYIDDIPEFIEKAQTLGLKGMVYKSPEEVEKTLLASEPPSSL